MPELPRFARALVQLASKDALLRRVVDAVSCGNAAAYETAVAEAKFQDFCHFLCRYVCSTLYRLRIAIKLNERAPKQLTELAGVEKLLEEQRL